MNRVVRKRRSKALISRDLPLVVADDAELEQLAEVLFQRKYLSQTPLIRESLTRCYVDSSLLPMDLQFVARFKLVPLFFVTKNVVPVAKLLPQYPEPTLSLAPGENFPVARRTHSQPKRQHV
jgi:hypothetical protein